MSDMLIAGDTAIIKGFGFIGKFKDGPPVSASGDSLRGPLGK